MKWRPDRKIDESADREREYERQQKRFAKLEADLYLVGMRHDQLERRVKRLEVESLRLSSTMAPNPNAP